MSDLTDFETHRIEGFAHAATARGINGKINVPLVSHIHGNLWMGGCKNGVRLPDDFRYVLSLYPWERYELGARTVRYEARLYDSADIPDREDLDALVEIVQRETAKGKTLVHCQAGLNRSGLICALALVRQGWPVTRALALLRTRRCSLVLCNPAFEAYVLGERKAA